MRRHQGSRHSGQTKQLHSHAERLTATYPQSLSLKHCYEGRAGSLLRLGTNALMRLTCSLIVWNERARADCHTGSTLLLAANFGACRNAPLDGDSTPLDTHVCRYVCSVVSLPGRGNTQSRRRRNRSPIIESFDA